jgi:hypothetical protein
MKIHLPHILKPFDIVAWLLVLVLLTTTAAIPDHPGVFFSDENRVADSISGTLPLSSFSRSENSVLISGNWYKLGVQQTGIHKITFEDLSAYGLDPAGIDPRNIRIYGNGPGMLPELNATPRPDDLSEIAIFVSGEADGIFNTEDYILFYGQSQLLWNFNPFNGNFEHANNFYSEVTCYFLTSDLGPGKRIGTIVSTTLPPTDYVTVFDDFIVWEDELVNLVKSGKIWYGKKYDQIDSVALHQFLFPDLDVSSQVHINLHVAAKSTSSSNFTVYYEGEPIANAQVTGIQPTATTIYARKSKDSELFWANGDSIELRVAYWAPTTTSYGWLNYIELNVMRHLIFREEQLIFRSTEATGREKVARYFLSGAGEEVTIWEITNPSQVSRVETELNGEQLTFSLNTDSLRHFVAFNTSHFHSPVFIEKTENQNLHALEPVDLVIISHPLFLDQAAELGEMHLVDDGLTYLLVTPDRIYNEFSSGVKDISAIRDFVRMLYLKPSSGHRVRYLLLVGDGSFDPKERTIKGSDLIPTFQSEESLLLTSTFVTDDFYGLFDDSEGEDATGIPDIGIGRFPVNTEEEVNHILDKIDHYLNYKEQVMGSWRNQICFLADDEDLNLHFNQAEELAWYVDSAYNQYNIDKIYFDAYQQVNTPIGQRYPDAKKALNKKIEEGALIINYTGHGGETGWAGEQVLESSDINSWTNIDKLPLFVTATCEFSRFDDHDRTSAGELVFMNNNGGGIALITTTRLAFAQSNFQMNKRFYKYALVKVNGEYPRLGDLIRLSKTHPENDNIRNIVLLGDPALQLAYPNYKAVVTSFKKDDQQGSFLADTIGALSEVTVGGEIRDDLGALISSFNGTLQPVFYDKPDQFSTLANDPRSKEALFSVQKSILFEGNVTVSDGEFEFTFLVPKDISFNYGNGRLSFYAMNDATDASGFYEDFVLGGTSENGFEDLTGPEIGLYLNDPVFRSGDVVNPEAVLFTELSDPSGISALGNGIGHDIVVILDDETENSILLNDYFKLDPDSYQTGRAVYPFSGLADGFHTLTLKAWDLRNNSSTATIDFTVSDTIDLAVRNLINYPNPFRDYTYFSFDHNQFGESLSAGIDIWTINGALVRTLGPVDIATEGYQASSLFWDGQDSDGNHVSGGIYIYHLTLDNKKGSQKTLVGKLIVLN